jgi:hypothetical protein
MKEQTAWAIAEHLSSGWVLCHFTIRRSKKDAIDQIKRTTGYLSWTQLKRDLKLKAVQITIFWEPL